MGGVIQTIVHRASHSGASTRKLSASQPALRARFQPTLSDEPPASD